MCVSVCVYFYVFKDMLQTSRVWKFLQSERIFVWFRSACIFVLASGLCTCSIQHMSNRAADTMRQNIQRQKDGFCIHLNTQTTCLLFFFLSLPLQFPLTLFPALEMIIACSINFIQQLVICFKDIILFVSANTCSCVCMIYTV